MECINLRQRFGKVYRITYDPAYDHKGIHRKNLDPWYMQIPCRKGVIYPQGSDRLAVEIDYHGPTAKLVSKIPGITRTQRGDNEQTFTFHVDLFDQIAELVQPKKRRVLTEEQRQELAQRIQRAREVLKERQEIQDK